MHDWIERSVPERPAYVERLDIASLASGQLHRLAVGLVDDAASRSVRVPVLVVKGSAPGPVVGMTAAVHGNELNGIPSIVSLIRRLDPEQVRGTVVGVTVANMPAFTRMQRRYPDHEDLNQVFPGRANGTESQVYAHRLLHRIVRHFDVLLDLHTASFGRVNSYYVRADMSNETTATFARLVGPEIIVHDPSKETTLRGAAENLSIPAVTVEIGDPHIFDADLTRASRIGLREILEALDVVDPDDERTSGRPVECVSSRWLYTDTGGILTVLPPLAGRIAAGDVIARLVDPWGQLLRTYIAPEEGVCIGKSSNPVARTGSRILHLGRPGAVPVVTTSPGVSELMSRNRRG